MSPAAPATCGAAMLVPLYSAQRPALSGTEERTLIPGAVTSGLRRSESAVGPAELNVAIVPPSSAAATVIAPCAVPGETTVPRPNSSKSLPPPS